MPFIYYYQNMNKIFTIRICALIVGLAFGVIAANAQQHKFTPERFQQEFQQFVISTTSLSEQDSASFFSLNDQLQNEKRELRDQIQQLSKEIPADDAQSRKLIEESDSLEIKIKELERDYHQKMMESISPLKVFQIMNAQSLFVRQELRKAANRR